MEAAPHPWPALGVLLVRDGLVSKEELDAILEEQRLVRHQRVSGRQLGEILVEREMVTPKQVARLVAEQYELLFVDLETSDIDVRIASVLDRELAERLSAIPIHLRVDGSYLLAIADPATVLFSDELRRALGSPPHFAVVGPEAIASAIAFVHDQPHGLPDTVEDPEDDDERDPCVVLEFPGDESDGSTVFENAFGARATVSHGGPPLGALLLRDGLVSKQDLEEALAQQQLSTSWRLGEILVDRDLVSTASVARLIAEQYELPYVNLADMDIDTALGARLPVDVARKYPAIPVSELDDGTLEVAIADPTDGFYSDELHRELGVQLRFVVAAPDAINAALESVYALDLEPAASDASEVLVEDVVAEELDIVDANARWLPTWRNELQVADDASEVPVELETDDPVGSEAGPDDLAVALRDEAAAMTDVDDATAADETNEYEERVESTLDDLDDGRDDLDDAIEQELAIDAALESGHALDLEPAASDASDELVDDVAAERLDLDADARWLPTWTNELQLADETSEAPVELETDDPVGSEAAPDDLVVALVDDAADTADVENSTGAAETDQYEERLESTLDDLDEGGNDLDDAIEQELALGASAFHFSPQGEWRTVRVRIDGLVRELGVVSQDDLEALVARVEASGAMRVHVTPTKQGDKVTLFPRAGSTTPIALTELGMGVDALETVQETLARRAGVTVVCGPGASGTTTTLYAALDVLNTPDRIVATIEAPVDRLVEGIDQMEVDALEGFTFSRGLETLLAIDSDVVLVGELGDRETAELAFGAARAGRQILGGLGVPSSARAIRHLTVLGVDSSVLAEALVCVVAQRLARRVCGECRETYYASEPELTELGQPVHGSGPRLLARGRGCEACDGTGYRDRVGFFEVIPVSDEIRGLIENRASSTEIHDEAVARGMRTLREDGIRLCLEGVTTFAEVQRVLGLEG